MYRKVQLSCEMTHRTNNNWQCQVTRKAARMKTKRKENQPLFERITVSAKQSDYWEEIWLRIKVNRQNRSISINHVLFSVYHKLQFTDEPLLLLITLGKFFRYTSVNYLQLNCWKITVLGSVPSSSRQKVESRYYYLCIHRRGKRINTSLIYEKESFVVQKDLGVHWI